MSTQLLPTQHVAALHAAKDLRLEERILCPPQEGEAQVAVMSTGLCGSDLHYYAHGRNANNAFVRAPLVLGHEAAGVITAVGPGVRNLVPGQRVAAIEAGVMCNDCSYCASNRYNLCKGMRFCSSASTFPHADGTLQQRMNHPAHVLHPIPDNCSFEQAALAEPLSVLLHATSRAGLAPSTQATVLVFGVGPIGLLACALSKSYGATRVVALDINPTRLDFALKNSFADQVHCLDPVPEPDPDPNPDAQLLRAKETISAALAKLGLPTGCDFVFECTGAESCIQMSVHAAATGGKVVLVGMGAHSVVLPVAAAATREVDILGSFRYAHTYPDALVLLAAAGLPGIERMITHRFGLEDSARALELLERGCDDEGNMILKVMVSEWAMGGRIRQTSTPSRSL